MADADATEEVVEVVKPEAFRELLEDFLRLFNPPGLAELDSVLSEYDGQEETLAALLEECHTEAEGFFARYEYHFASRFFDARKALYDGHVVPPVPLCRPLDNLHKAQVLVPTKRRPLVRLGVLHEQAVAERDQQWLRGKLPPCLIDWLADAVPPGPLRTLRDLFLQRARVRVRLRTAYKHLEEGDIVTAGRSGQGGGVGASDGPAGKSLAAALARHLPGAAGGSSSHATASSSSSSAAAAAAGQGGRSGAASAPHSCLVRSVTGLLRGFDAEWNLILIDVQEEVFEVPAAAEGGSGTAEGVSRGGKSAGGGQREGEGVSAAAGASKPSSAPLATSSRLRGAGADMPASSPYATGANAAAGGYGGSGSGSLHIPTPPSEPAPSGGGEIIWTRKEAPPGWTKRYETFASARRPYYFNTLSGEAAWDAPDWPPARPTPNLREQALRTIAKLGARVPSGHLSNGGSDAEDASFGVRKTVDHPFSSRYHRRHRRVCLQMFVPGDQVVSVTKASEGQGAAVSMSSGGGGGPKQVQSSAWKGAVIAAKLRR